MTEIMVRTSVGENFSYAKTEFEQIQSIKKSDMVINDDLEDESTLSFNSKLDTTCDKSSESTICGSITDDSVVSGLQSTVNLTDMAVDVQDSADNTIKSDTSCEDYEYMTAETTVINTTYNMISQSNVNDVKKIPSDQPHASSQSIVKDTTDKSKVIVQILSSDRKNSTKSQSVSENKVASENQTTNSFRDDVFKILSKPRSSFGTKTNNKQEADLKTFNVCKSVQIKSSTKIFKTKRRRALNPYLTYGNGQKLGDIREVGVYLRAATTRALRVLHFVLYDKYGLCGSAMQIEKTRRKILLFSGFPFDNNSLYYKKRLNSLLKIPVRMLRETHEAVFGKNFHLSRNHMVHNLMSFLSDTETYYNIVYQMKQNLKSISENEYADLKEKAKSGPAVVVKLKKLSDDDVNSVLNQMKMKMDVEEQRMQVENAIDETANKSDEIASFILKGPGKKLKHFPAIVRNIENASEDGIKLLHHLLYGRHESKDMSRRNILEFSGFVNSQKEFIAERERILKGLKRTKMFELCKLLCLRARTNSKTLRIMKIMNFLRAPFNPFKIKASEMPLRLPKSKSSESGVLVQYLSRKEIYKSLKRKDKVSTKYLSRPKITVTGSRVPVSPLELWEEPEDAQCKDGGYRLRDFEKICRNIACSVPSDLTELNDLLFMKPSDDTEIHDRILDFTRFGFTESSIHYHYRKTLMFYMGPCIVRKIAKLLDIENWQMISSHEDLSVCILKFLMKHKIPDLLPAPSLLPPSLNSSFSHSTSINKPESSKYHLPLQSPCVTYPAEVPQQMDQANVCCQENMVVSNLSTSPQSRDLYTNYDKPNENADLERRNDFPLSGAGYTENDDSVPLSVFIHHPLDEELKGTIEAIIREEMFSITLGDLVKKVYDLYPGLNLTYRENFIKIEARKILSEMRKVAYEKIKHDHNCSA